jgi:hypothetical protein
LQLRSHWANKARNHRLIIQGLLIDYAEVESMDRGTLIGALMAVKNSKPESMAGWKQKGDEVLKEREPQKP